MTSFLQRNIENNLSQSTLKTHLSFYYMKNHNHHESINLGSPPLSNVFQVEESQECNVLPRLRSSLCVPASLIIIIAQRLDMFICMTVFLAS